MNTSVTQAPTQVIEAQRTDKGSAFELPFDAAAVAKIEAIDLDLLITLKDGQQFVLTQAGLLAMTQPDSVLRYAGGLEVLAADEVKQIGAMQSMEANTLRLAGNFRLASLELDENEIDRVSGTGFGLGQELVDITAKLDQSSQKIEQMLQSLEQATQASNLASSGDEPPPAVSTGVKRLSKNTNPDLYSSPTPGTPPQKVKKEDQTNENTSNFTTDNTNNNINDNTNNFTTDNTNNNVNNNTSNANAVTPKISATLLAANKSGVNFQEDALNKTEVRQLLGRDTVELSMNDTAKNLEFEAGKIENQLVLKSVPTTTSLLVDIYSNGNNFPEGLTINGQAFTPGTPITLDVTGMKDNEVPLNLQWIEGAKAASSDFQITVAYAGPDGESQLKIITFTGDAKDAYTLDRFGEPIQFIASQADNLVVTANDEDNTITLGNGNDTIKGSGGADIINGGGGKDTVDYSASTDPVTVNVVSGVVTDGQANDDQLSNIETLTGSSARDTLDFSGANSAVNANFITGTTNQKLNGSDENLTFSGFENAVGSGYKDVFVANSAANKFEGGEGSDTVSYAGSTAVKVDLHEGKGFDGNASGDTYKNIENVIGSSFNDTFIASDATNTFTSGGGVDRVSYVHSTSGVKVDLSSGKGSGGFATDDEYIDIVNATGSDYDDTFVANNQGNNFQGGDGFDTVSYEKSSTGATGQGVAVNLSNIEASYVGHNGVIVKLKKSSGTGYDATGDTYDSIEKVIGSKGNDIFIASDISNKFEGGDGSDTVSYAGLNIGSNQTGVTVNLLDENKVDGNFKSIENITGSAGQDELRGDNNNNVLMGGDGADQFFGGGGFDTVSYQDSTTGVSIDVDNTTLDGVRGTGFAKGDVIANDVERILGSNFNDTFLSTRKEVVLYGGNGTDSIDFGLATDDVTVDLGDTSKFVSIERVVGSNFNDTLTAASNNGSTAITNNSHILTADNSKSILVAGDGDDTLNGGSGADFIDMKTSNASLELDMVNAGAGNDTVWIKADHVGGTVKNLDGGTGFDTLRVIAGATLDLGSLNAVNFERVDLRADGGATHVTLSSADIRALVNSGTGNNVLTLRLDSNDTFTIEAENNVRVAQGQSVSFYNTANDNLIAQVNFLYA